jgi:hypothetical protein
MSPEPSSIDDGNTSRIGYRAALCATVRGAIARPPARVCDILHKELDEAVERGAK